MATPLYRNALLAVALVSTTVAAGCGHYIKREEFDATIADLRAVDARLESEIQTLSQKHDALVTKLAGRTRVDTAAYFATGDAPSASRPSHCSTTSPTRSSRATAPP